MLREIYTNQHLLSLKKQPEVAPIRLDPMWSDTRFQTTTSRDSLTPTIRLTLIGSNLWGPGIIPGDYHKKVKITLT
jgi:hypothetical protein